MTELINSIYTPTCVGKTKFGLITQMPTSGTPPRAWGKLSFL